MRLVEDSTPEPVREETTEPIPAPERPRRLSRDERVHLQVHVNAYEGLAGSVAATATAIDFFWSHGGEGEGDDDVARSLADAYGALDAAAREVARLVRDRFGMDVTR